MVCEALFFFIGSRDCYPDKIPLLIVNIIDQAFRSDDLLHKLRKRLSLEAGSPGYIGDNAGVKVNFHFIPCLNASGGLRAFDDGQSDIDGVPVKNPGKSLCDDTADPGCFDGNGGVLSG